MKGSKVVQWPVSGHAWRRIGHWRWGEDEDASGRHRPGRGGGPHVRWLALEHGGGACAEDERLLVSGHRGGWATKAARPRSSDG
jgi:hypothetical protein